MKVKNFLNRNKFKGVSLLELLIAIALAGIVGVLVAGIFFANSRLFSDQQTSIAVSDQNRLALDEITKEVRQSVKVVETCAGCGGETTGGNTLILRNWPIDSAGKPIPPAGCFYDYIIYKRNTANNNLLKQIIPHSSSARTTSTKIIATDVVDLQFSYENPNPPDANQISTTVQTQASTIFGKTHSSAQEAKAVLRNR